MVMKGTDGQVIAMTAIVVIGRKCDVHARDGNVMQMLNVCKDFFFSLPLSYVKK